MRMVPWDNASSLYSPHVVLSQYITFVSGRVLVCAHVTRQIQSRTHICSSHFRPLSRSLHLDLLQVSTLRAGAACFGVICRVLSLGGRLFLLFRPPLGFRNWCLSFVSEWVSRYRERIRLALSLCLDTSLGVFLAIWLGLSLVGRRFL